MEPSEPAREVHVQGSSNVIVVGGGTATLNGFSAAQVKGLLKDERTTQQGQLEALSRSLNISREALHGFFGTLQQKDVPDDQLLLTLSRIAARYKDMLAQQAVLEPESETAKSAVENAGQVLTVAGSDAAYDRADALLGQAESAELLASQDAAEIARKAAEAAARRRVNAAELRAQRGRISLTRLDFLSAAEHFRGADALVQDEPDPNKRYFDQYAMALAMYGNYQADTASLDKAEQGFRYIIEQLSGDEWKTDRARMLTNVATVLSTAGERDQAPDRLNRAVEAARQALQLLDAYRDRVAWSHARIAEGQALSLLGKSGKTEQDRQQLQDGATALREGVAVLLPGDAPEERASALMELSDTLSLMDAANMGSNFQQEALDRAREALAIVPPAPDPLRWAALINVSVAAAGMDRGPDATTAQETAAPVEPPPLEDEVLAKAPPKKEPRPEAKDPLEEALENAQQALREFPRDTLPVLEWATAQANVGSMLFALGKRQPTLEQKVAKIEEARKTILSALEECTEARFPERWADYQTQLGEMSGMLAQAMADPAEAESEAREAMAAFANAQRIRTAAVDRSAWELLETQRAWVAAVIGQQIGSGPLLEEAVAGYNRFLASLEPGDAERARRAGEAERDKARAALVALVDVPKEDAPQT